MRLKSARSALRSPSGNRGAIMLFWLMVAMPLIWIVGAFSVDYARVVIAQKQAASMAESAALASVTQFSQQCGPNNSDNRCLDVEDVNSVVAETRDRFIDNEAMRGMTDIRTEVTVADNGPPVIPEGRVPSVEVTVSYQVPSLMFFGLATFDVARTTQSGTVSRTAYVCDPNVQVPGVLSSSCQRPR